MTRESVLVAKQLASALHNQAIFSSILVNVKDLGAKGDGENDDTNAFVKATSLGSGVIKVPPGTYKIRPGEVALGVGQTLSGSGIRASSIYVQGDDSTGITLNGLGSGIENIQIFGDDAATSGSGIFAKSSNVRICNVFVHSVYDAIYIKGVSPSQLVSIVYMNEILIENTGNNGLTLQNVNDAFMDQFIINAGSNIPISGIRLLDKVEAFTASNGDVLNFKFSITSDASNPVAGSRPAYNKFVNVYFDSSSEGALVDKMVSFDFANCWFSNRPGNGCTIQNSEDIVFDNCDFINNGSNGALLQNTSKRVKFLGCSVLSNNASNGGSNGILVAAGASDFIIKDCTFTNGLGFPGQQGYGVFVVDGNSDRYIIADNLVSGNNTGGVYDGGTGINKKVANNY